MGMEGEHTSGDIQEILTTTPPTSSSSEPKISMFAKKSGFVIPKNKLSGSLVPIHRDTKKGDADSVNEEETNQVVRKTKWGLDLTLDTSVRKGKALAYQTRIDQISKLLTLSTMEVDSHGDSLSVADHQLSKEEADLLGFERREIIGELLKLNPTYKAPPDYKPLLKEAKVQIPIKESHEHNLIGLVFGPANDSRKRLEKETGAKIQVYGTKSDMRGKFEITPTDGNEIDNSYEDLYVQVSADTFEKVDAAVAVIELLLTTVLVNPVSPSTMPTSVPDNNIHTNAETPSSIISSAPTNQGTTQPPQGQIPQYSQQWFPSNQAHTPTFFPNSSNPTGQVSSSLIGPRPAISPSFSPVLQNPPHFPSRPHTSLQSSYLQHIPQLGQTGGPRNNFGPPLMPSFNVRPMLSTSTPPIVPSHGHNNVMTVASQPPPVNMITPHFVPPRPESTCPPNGPAPPAMAQAFRPLMPLPQPSVSNSMLGCSQSFDTVKPSPTRPQQPSSGDFTFQPCNQRPNAATQVWHSNQLTGSIVLRPGMGNLNHPRAEIEMKFSLPPRHPIMPTAPHMQMQPRNFGPFPPRTMHNLENHHRPLQRFSSPHQHFESQPGRPFSGVSGGPQVYDPFSPNPRMGGKTRAHGESDPEYEDLMASVGIQ